jgi:hypothetical protein
MQEHRAAQRRRILKAASISFGGGAIDCTIRNLSETGASLDVISPVGIPGSRLSWTRIEASCPAASCGGRRCASAFGSRRVSASTPEPWPENRPRINSAVRRGAQAD